MNHEAFAHLQFAEPLPTLPEVEIRNHFSSAFLHALDMGISEAEMHEILTECMACPSKSS